MKKQWITVIVLSVVWVNYFTDAIGQTKVKYLQVNEHPVQEFKRPGLPSNPAFGDANQQKKLREINKVFDDRINAVKQGPDNQYISKQRRLRVLEQQRDALLKDIELRGER